MATTRPEASETTGTLRETSGTTVPVTTNSEVVGCAVASTGGKCSGWSTVKRLRSTSGTTLAGGGASAAASTCPLHPSSISGKNMEARRRPIFTLRLFIWTPYPSFQIIDTCTKLRRSRPHVLPVGIRSVTNSPQHIKVDRRPFLPGCLRNLLERCSKGLKAAPSPGSTGG